ncbi:MAG: universal stress protein [Taibaiella sp.]|nr:universal stress protein [Taibaiella sp.]
MSYLIAATDFSDTSENSVAYAAALATILQADLVLVHSFIFPVMVNDLPLPTSLIDDTQMDAEKKMNVLLKNMQAQHAGLTIKGSVTYGNITDTINNYAAENAGALLVVMGNSNTAADSAWFLSTLKEASHTLSIPTLAIPDNAFYKPISKICLAVDTDQPENLAALKSIADLAQQLNAELHVFNSRAEGTYDGSQEVSTGTMTTLAAANPQYHYRHLADVDEAILFFCSRYQIDWLAILPGKYSFFEGLFHNSHTKVLAQTTTIPLCILQQDEL